jgi:thioredoxin 1
MEKFIPIGLLVVYIAYVAFFGCPFSNCSVAEASDKKQIKEQKGGNTMSKVIELRDEDFDQEVLTATSPVIVDFFATWCGPCKMQHPVLEQFAEEFAGKVKVAKLDVDASETKAREYKIRSVPTLMIFKGGKVVETMLGYHSKEELEAAVSKHW